MHFFAILKFCMKFKLIDHWTVQMLVVFVDGQFFLQTVQMIIISVGEQFSAKSTDVKYFCF